MIKSLVTIFVVIVLAFLSIVGIVAYKVYLLIRRLRGNTKASSCQNTYWQGSGGAGGAQSHNTYANGAETIYDTRTPQEAKRKIFSSDEGEYVDFKE